MDGADSTAVNNNPRRVFPVFVSGACACPACYSHATLQTAATVNGRYYQLAAVIPL